MGVSRWGRVALTSVLFLPSIGQRKPGQCLLGAWFPVYKMEIKSCTHKCRWTELATAEHLLDWFQSQASHSGSHQQPGLGQLIPKDQPALWLQPSLCNLEPPGKRSWVSSQCLHVPDLEQKCPGDPTSPSVTQSHGCCQGVMLLRDHVNSRQGARLRSKALVHFAVSFLRQTSCH